MANIQYLRQCNEAIKLLTHMKMIASYPYRDGYLVARYGVNKTTLKRMAKRLDGVK